ncbi:MAG TPA: helix-turn-helix transcriptional regulator [Vicinamibacterales bacterium]|nr:helix-turn-helix transcriptional regulator [Vicinamibacterales bacterium]
MDDVRTAIGRRVRELRQGLKLSQEALAERAQLHPTYIGGIERGERNVSAVNIERIAAGLNTSLADLFAPFKHVPKPGEKRSPSTARKPRRTRRQRR